MFAYTHWDYFWVIAFKCRLNQFLRPSFSGLVYAGAAQFMALGLTYKASF